MADLTCSRCATPADGAAPWRCAACGAPLSLTLPAADASTFTTTARHGVWRYRGWLPASDEVTLGEPTTGLVELRDRPGTLAKSEGSLPTGSFKDRGVAVTLGWLRARGVREVIVNSSGNAGASFAAYAARAGIRARVFVPADASPAKLLQVRAHGAEIVTVPGSRSATGAAARRALDDAGPEVAYASHLWQPAFLAGTATFAYELYEQLGRAPDTVVAPLGGGTLLLGVALGFRRLRKAGVIGGEPRLIGVQSSACAPLAAAFRAGADDVAAVEPGTTIAEGIKIAQPPRAAEILGVIRSTGGAVVEVDDDAIRESVRALLAQGIFAEPTSAAAHAGLGLVGLDSGTTVIALTGHGLKAAATIGDLIG